VNTGAAVKCNNDHGISPDGKELVVSHHGQDGKSMIYVLPVSGGEPRLVTSKGPSYWHGWSPDGKTLAYCAERGGEFDVYTIPVTGGEETRLTTAPGLDDGPEYSPDGEYIYMNSVRTGQMKIWRMKADGSDQVQITPDDQYGDWFAHPSPDNKWLIFVSYDKSVEGHPANKNVALRLMPVGGKEVKVIARLFGGQGTINVPSWDIDNKTAAFVSYRLVKP
ncbi:MAG: TolB family protein, partial [Syntrophothermus sp.]